MTTDYLKKNYLLLELRCIMTIKKFLQKLSQVKKSRRWLEWFHSARPLDARSIDFKCLKGISALVRLIDLRAAIGSSKKLHRPNCETDHKRKRGSS